MNLIGMNNVSLDEKTWCGVTVASSVTGIAVEELNELTLAKGAYCRKRKVNGITTPTSMYSSDLKFILEYHNYECNWERWDTAASLNGKKQKLYSWYQMHAAKGTTLFNRTIVFLVTGHFVVLNKGMVIDTFSGGKPVPVKDCYAARKNILHLAVIKKSAKRIIKRSDVKNPAKVITNRAPKARDYSINPKRVVNISWYRLDISEERSLRFSSFSKAYDYLINYVADEQELKIAKSDKWIVSRVRSARAVCKSNMIVNFHDDNTKTLIANIVPITN
jgi:hypothetical protein